MGDVIRSFKDLIVWQKGVQISTEIYKITRKFPKEEMYGLTSQVRRATVSVPANVAEGWGREHRADYRRFVGIALGSLAELETLLTIAKETQILSSADFSALEKSIHGERSLLVRLRRSLSTATLILTHPSARLSSSRGVGDPHCSSVPLQFRSPPCGPTKFAAAGWVRISVEVLRIRA